jgi:hypothetical protein
MQNRTLNEFTPHSLLNQWRGFSKLKKATIITVASAVLILVLWLIWIFWLGPLIERKAYEGAKLQTNTEAAKALKEASETKGQLQQLKTDYEGMKTDYEATKQELATLKNDLQSANQATGAARVKYETVRHAPVRARVSGTGISDDELRRDSERAKQAIKP